MTRKKQANETSCHLRQQLADRQYAVDYQAWVSSLAPLERRKLEERGLGKPDVSYSTYLPDSMGVMESLADTSTVAIPEKKENEEGVAAKTEALRMLRIVLSNVFYPGPGRSREYELDIIGVSIGMLGMHSISAVARRHGVCRAAVSKAAVKFCAEANIPPSVYMKSEANRERHRQTNKPRRKKA